MMEGPQRGSKDMLQIMIKGLATTLSEPRANKYDQYDAIVKSLNDLVNEISRPLNEKIAAQQKLLDAIDEHLSQNS